MPVPLAAVVIGAAASAITGRLVKKQLDVHNRLEKLKKEKERPTVGIKGRTNAGIKGSAGKNVNKVYK